MPPFWSNSPSRHALRASICRLHWLCTASVQVATHGVICSFCDTRPTQTHYTRALSIHEIRLAPCTTKKNEDRHCVLLGSVHFSTHFTAKAYSTRAWQFVHAQKTTTKYTGHLSPCNVGIQWHIKRGRRHTRCRRHPELVCTASPALHEHEARR